MTVADQKVRRLQKLNTELAVENERLTARVAVLMASVDYWERAYRGIERQLSVKRQIDPGIGNHNARLGL